MSYLNLLIKDSLLMPTFINLFSSFTDHYPTMALDLVQNQEQNNSIIRSMTLTKLLSKAGGKPYRIIGLMSKSGKVPLKQLIRYK